MHVGRKGHYSSGFAGLGPRDVRPSVSGRNAEGSRSAVDWDTAPQIPEQHLIKRAGVNLVRDASSWPTSLPFAELNYFPALLRGNPRHFSLKAVRDVKLDYLGHGSRQLALWNGARLIASIGNHPEPKNGLCNGPALVTAHAVPSQFVLGFTQAIWIRTVPQSWFQWRFFRNPCEEWIDWPCCHAAPLNQNIEAPKRRR